MEKRRPLIEALVSDDFVNLACIDCGCSDHSGLSPHRDWTLFALRRAEKLKGILDDIESAVGYVGYPAPRLQQYLRHAYDPDMPLPSTLSPLSNLETAAAVSNAPVYHGHQVRNSTVGWLMSHR